MSFKILYVIATEPEARTLKLKIDSMRESWFPGKFEIHFLITGVGSAATAWNLKDWIVLNGKPDLAINTGIAGSFRDDIFLGDVVMPVTDCFADSGIEDGDRFLTLHEAGLIGEDEFPFRNGILNADPEYIGKLKDTVRPVKAITLNTATGSELSRLRLVGKFNPDIETMEGATFFYICSRENIRFLALRAISNKVEKRNKNNWNISLALNNLSEKVLEILLKLQ